jgi:hypothetical protein
MLRAVLRLGILLAAAAVIPAAAGQTPVVSEGYRSGFTRYTEWRPTLNRLAKAQNLDGFLDPKTGRIDPKMTVEDALDRIADCYDMAFVVNEMAFRADGIPDVLDLRMADKSLSRMPRATAAAVLEEVLSRIPAPSGATYVIRDGVVELTTQECVRNELALQLRRGLSHGIRSLSR